jgi:chaperonin GroES
MTPMFDRVVLLQDDKEEKTSTGIFIPTASAEQANTGKVTATGPGKVSKEGVTIPMTVKVGDRVMFPLGAGLKVKVDGQDLLVLKEEELIAIVD